MGPQFQPSIGATMPTYVDGFVVPVAKKDIDAYRRMARKFDGKRMFWGGFRQIVAL
jgi:uncharacterized protein YbaA (DUF1428 family)